MSETLSGRGFELGEINQNVAEHRRSHQEALFFINLIFCGWMMAVQSLKCTTSGPDDTLPSHSVNLQ